MMNSQKFLILLVMTSILIGMVSEIYSNPTVFNPNTVNNFVTTYDTQINEVKTQSQPTAFNKAQQIINNALDQAKLLSGFIGILWSGLNPLSIVMGITYETSMEIMIAYALTLFRLFVGFLSIMEIYFIVINKKQG